MSNEFYASGCLSWPNFSTYRAGPLEISGTYRAISRVFGFWFLVGLI